MSVRNLFIIAANKVFLKLLKLFSLGSGSTWPGHIALKLNPHFVKDILSNSPTKVILIAGTNGKTTTSTLLRFLLEKEGKTVFQNEEGANLLNGIASNLIKHATISGKIKDEFAVFEVDENSLPLILDQSSPEAVIVLNLFRDQLDRYGEVNLVAKKWKERFKTLSTKTTLVLNGDDPQIAYLGLNIPADVECFGLESSLMESKAIPHDVDSIYCPNCGEKLEYESMSYSHLGNYQCNNCEFKRPRVTTYSSKDITTQLKGIYNIYNISAVFLTLEKVLATPLQHLFEGVKEFKPAFGRQEVLRYKERDVFLILSKNPTGFNQSIQAVINNKPAHSLSVLILLNDRVPDGRDISWIWDVEFQDLLPAAKKIVLSGDRTYDLALRFKYCLDADEKISSNNNKSTFSNITAAADLSVALEDAIVNTVKDETLYVLSTYSAMLDIRKLLIGKKLL
ncbi:MAG: MurT ligase domain-containing protein [Patescibacteria group bacterium]